MTGADAAQRAAADPGASAWVDASAGSGKTKVLVDRALRLLLGAGAPPAEPRRILCLTFTNAAAAEMANRLNDRLARWAVAADAELDAELAQLAGAPPDAGMRDTARRLLARVLDAPGGMPIVTVHAFCQSLLRRFPLEAGVPPRFEVLDERESREAMDEAQRALIANPGPALRGALDTLVRRVHETRVTDLLGELAGERARLRRIVDESGGLEALVERTHKAIGIARGTEPEDVVRAACAPGAADDEDALRALAAAMAAGGKGDKERAAAMSAWLAADGEARTARFDSYVRAFLTADDSPRKTVATKAVRAGAPGFDAVIAAEQARLARAVRDRKRAAVAAATTALLTLGGAVLDAYEERKRARGGLDFDDLVLSARGLLTHSGAAAWVLYKLDGGVDHVLIDEAQDTNPEQWEAVRALTEEFFAGAGARAGPRTVFAVGDPKQSIYGFQRADPAKFSEMKDWFADRARGAGLRWEDAPLETSFRSAAPVLAAVDAAFAAEDAASGVIFGGRPVRHEARREGQAGRVEFWPAVEAEAPEPPPPWKPPVERIAPPAPLDLLAERVAAHIATLCDGSTMLESRGRPARPGDVLVLVRRRNRFGDELARRLKSTGVEVAGADRLVLAEHIAVMDLVALGRFLLLPGDDLSLAEALKSPLFGFDDDALFPLAHRRETTLWARLNAEAGANPLYAGAAERLRALLARADRAPPWELYAELLAAGGGRRRFRERFGAEADDPLDEFLAQALAYERAAAPSLQGFLHWLETGGVEVKRDGDPGGGAVRVMTVHGAKGMEAPVVYLPDTMATPRSRAQLVWAPDGGMVLWPIRSEYWDPLSRQWRDAAQERELDEHRRLLYVAMTRAEDRLVVCGWAGRGERKPESWHAMVERGLAGLPGAREEDDGVRVLQCAQTAAPDRADGRAPEAAPGAAPPPSWIGAAPPAEKAPKPGGPPSSAPAFAPEAEARGLRLHRALQAWPDLPPDLSADDRARLERIVEVVEADPVFAPLFGPGGVAEAWVGAPGPRAFSGRIDRLAVAPGAVLALDFKTGGEEAHAERPPAAYLRQMAAYRGALRAAFPGRPVRCALAWVDLGRLSPLDDSLLDAHAP